MSPLITELQTVLRNDTILSAVSFLPKGLQLLKSMAQILTQPEIKQLFGQLFDLNCLQNYLIVELQTLKILIFSFRGETYKYFEKISFLELEISVNSNLNYKLFKNTLSHDHFVIRIEFF